MDYKDKYLKYKIKYMNLKSKHIHNQVGGKEKLFPNQIDFVPEIDPIEIEFNEELFKKSFPEDKKVNFKKLKMSNIGKYSVSDPKSAQYISDVIKSYFPKNNNLIITDATANMGGNTINFAKNFSKVNSVEIIKLHCKFLENNIKQYKLSKNVNIKCNDYFDVMLDLKQDIIFIDPPWGGTDYKKIPYLDLSLNNVDIGDIVNKLKEKAKMIVLKVPKNFNLTKIVRSSNFKRIDIHKVCYDSNGVCILRYFYVIFLNF